MPEETLADDQSHYEVSLTAGQAFLAFVLLLLSLAASFAFGVVIGRGRIDDRFATRKEPVVTEAGAMPRKAVKSEVAVPADDFKEVEPPKITEGSGGQASSPVQTPAPPTAKPAAPPVPHFAQILSTSDQKTAEVLAAKVIDAGFTSAYVERGPTTEKGTTFRVRVKFPSEEEARAAEVKLKAFSREVWITKSTED